jgi:glycosyltransferase involved in cell wall biosynthesis
MILGIPTLNRYDLLDRLIASAEAGTVKPDRYVIIDNGGKYRLPEAFRARDDFELVSPGKNLGVAASWNLLLEMADADSIVISNDDIELQPDALEKFADAFESGHAFIGACGGWALFGQAPSVAEKIGLYDENFGMAYYEDCDYLLRLRAAGIPVHDLGYIGAHVGNASTHGGTAEEQALVAHSRERNYAYFVAKWGADSPRWGNPHVKNFAEPFDGMPPRGWANRTNMRDIIAPMRWDVLNYIAKKIGAKRYLEIGVADGSCMRRIEVEEKWGVDPNPQPGAVSASTIFVPRTSDFFFERLASTSGQFDLVFIDGDHRAEQVYREVHAAVTVLSPKGVICLHDCNPHSEEMQQVPLASGWQWTGDVWKAIARLRSEEEHRVRVIPSDYGIGIVLPGRPCSAPKLPAEWDRLLWRDLVAGRREILGLIAPGEWREYLDSQLQ